jgi:hypothetical protein
MRCEGPCGLDKHESAFHEYKPGRHRKVCRVCFNAGRTENGKIRSAADVSPNARTTKIISATDQAEAIEPKVKVIKVQETVTQVEEHRLKRRVKELEEARQDLLKQIDEGNVYNDVLEQAYRLGPAIPTIRPRERQQGKKREATPLVLASDWHIEQEVKSEAVAFRNRYNLDISKRRMQRFFEAIVWGIRQQRDTFVIRDLILWLGGDFIQNFLHEDDIENNLLAPLAAIRYWLAEMITGIDFILENAELEQIVLPCNDGNHGRTTKKMRASTRQDHSLETFAYAQLALHYKNEKRLKFVLPTSQFTFLDDVYGRTIRFLHGDVFKFGGGIGGITVPMFRAMGRWEKTKHADLTCMGHWHQRYCLPDCMVNGSLIGLDSFAMSIGASFEPPVQSMRMLDALRWCGSDIPLWVSEREDDIMNDKRAA